MDMFDGKEYIYAVYEEKSFSKAAQKLYITQPALSTAVKKVETRLGRTIFDRGTSPIGLTPSGEIYIDAIEKLYDLEENTVNQLNNLNGLLTGRLNIGGSIFFSSYVLPSLLAEFSRRYPQIQIGLVEGSTAQLVDKLFSEEIDFLVNNSELDDKIYEGYYYSTERIILAIPEKYEINQSLGEYRIDEEAIATNKYQDPDYPVLPLSLLKDIPFVFLKQSNDIYKRAVKMCGKYNFTPRVILKPDQLMTAFSLACKGIGATFVTDTLLHGNTYGVPLCFYKMEDELSIRNVYLYRKRNKYLTKAMEEFIHLVTGESHG